MEKANHGMGFAENRSNASRDRAELSVGGGARSQGASGGHAYGQSAQACRRMWSIWVWACNEAKLPFDTHCSPPMVSRFGGRLVDIPPWPDSVCSDTVRCLRTSCSGTRAMRILIIQAGGCPKWATPGRAPKFGRMRAGPTSADMGLASGEVCRLRANACHMRDEVDRPRPTSGQNRPRRGRVRTCSVKFGLGSTNYRPSVAQFGPHWANLGDVFARIRPDAAAADHIQTEHGRG